MKTRNFALAATLWSAASLATIAQVKGHAYYNWEGQLGADIRVEVLMEVDQQTDLAQGVIKYLRKSGSVSTIRLYGQPDVLNDDVSRSYILTEYLPSGKATGILSIELKNGRFKSGKWEKPDHSTSYDMTVTKNKSFPFSEYSTFFTKTETTTGVFRSIKPLFQDPTQTDSLYLVINDKKGYAHFSEEQKEKNYHQIDIINGLDCLTDFESTMYDGNKFMFTEGNTTFESYIYDDFVYVDVVYKESSYDEAAMRFGGYYIRQKNEKIVPMTNFMLGMYAHLKDGKVTVAFDPVKLEALFEERFVDYYMCPKGAGHELLGVEGNVKDIYCGMSGEEYHPILCLLLESGEVQILSAFETILRGGTTVSPKLWNVKNAEYFDSQIEEYDCKVLAKGALMDDAAEIYNNGWIGAEWFYNPDEEHYDCFEFGEEWHIYYHHGGYFTTDDVSENYYGICWPEKMEDDGTVKVFHYRFDEQNSSEDNYKNKPCKIEGTFEASWEYNDEYERILTLKPLTGMDFGIKKGQTRKYKFGISRG